MGFGELAPARKSGYLLVDLQTFVNDHGVLGEKGQVRTAGFGPTVDGAPLFMVSQCVVDGGPFPKRQMDLTFRGQPWGTISPDGTLHLPQKQMAGGHLWHDHDDVQWEMMAYLQLQGARFAVAVTPPAPTEEPAEPTG